MKTHLPRGSVVPKRSRLAVELLERRVPLAGNIVATANAAGELVIVGDSSSNCFVIEPIAQEAVRVSGCERTTINRRSAPFVAMHVRDDYEIQTRGGSDNITIHGSDQACAVVPDDLHLDTGRGNDSVNLNCVEIIDDAEIDTGSGADHVVLEDVIIAERFSANTSSGNDFLQIIASHFGGNAVSRLSSGDDRLCITGHVIPLPEPGFVEVIPSRFDGAASFDGGTGGFDRFVIDATEFASSPLIGDVAHNFEDNPDNCSFLLGS